MNFMGGSAPQQTAKGEMEIRVRIRYHIERHEDHNRCDHRQRDHSIIDNGIISFPHPIL